MKYSNKKEISAIRARIATKGIRAEDIKYQDRLSVEQISEIPTSNVYLWVHDGLWTYKDFRRWLNIAAPFEE